MPTAQTVFRRNSTNLNKNKAINYRDDENIFNNNERHANSTPTDFIMFFCYANVNVITFKSILEKKC